MIIAPSLLAADFSKIAREVARVNRSGAEWLHMDIMDGHFVQNISFGPEMVRVSRKFTKLFLDVHLMCSNPENLLEPFKKAGADSMTIHAELEGEVNSLIWKIRALGCQVGISVNPPTPVEALKPFLSKVDTVLIMTVNPGFGGQPFIEETIPKIQQVADWRTKKGLKYHIEVDGGINFETAVECARAGADTFVSGTGLFKQKSMRAAVRKMRMLAEAAAQRR